MAQLFLLKILTGIFSILPFRLLYLLSDGLGFLFSHIILYRQQVVRENLRRSFPEKSDAEREAIRRKFYRHLCDILLESVKGLSLSKKEFERRFHIRNPEVFEPLFQQGKSAIILGSHVGNWGMGRLFFPLYTQHLVLGIYKPLKNRLADDFLNKKRSRHGLRLAPMQKAGRAIIEHRNQPILLGLIADQTPSDIKNAHWLTFLNQDTPFLHGADKLARQTGYPVFMYNVQRVKRGFYEATLIELCAHPKGMKEGEITELFARQLESDLQKRPENWLWSHRRWKRKRLNNS